MTWIYENSVTLCLNLILEKFSCNYFIIILKYKLFILIFMICLNEFRELL